jgi:hypothetical protein
MIALFIEVTGGLLILSGIVHAINGLIDFLKAIFRVKEFGPGSAAIGWLVWLPVLYLIGHTVANILSPV